MEVELYKKCTKCILDTHDDSNIYFDSEGICNYCHEYEENIKKHFYGLDNSGVRFNQLIDKVKREKGKGKYDVIIGVSGGVDSTFVAYLCKKNNINPLVVHLDNGWNSELSVVNIKNILKYTGFDLFTYVINWKEFRDLQRSYFKANVIDIEMLTDHAIGAILTKVAIKNKVKFIFTGNSITTEGRLPSNWSFNKMDSINIKAIHKKHGTIPINTFPLLGYPKRNILKYMHNISSIDILDYVDYNKDIAKDLICKKFKWRDYGGKHYESIFTRFYQGYILPNKFNVDKRKSHYSNLICAGQLKREEAMSLMQKPPYPIHFMEKLDKEFVLKKLGFSTEEFDSYINSKEVSHLDYPSMFRYLLFLSKIKRKLLFWK